MDRLIALRTFVLVADRGGFSAASRHIGTSPSALSRQVNALEASLQCTLLHRSTHQVALTEAGRQLYRRAQQLLKEMDSACEEVAQLDLAAQGAVKLLVPHDFGNQHIAPLLPELAELHPGIILDLRVSDAFSDLSEEGVDLEVRVRLDKTGRLVLHPLTPNIEIACASPAYLARHGRPSKPGDLARHAGLVYLHLAARQEWIFLSSKGEALVVQPRVVMQCDDDTSLRAACVAGAGVGLFPVWSVRADLQAGRLLQVLGRYRVQPLFGETVYLASLPHRRHSLKVRAVREFLRSRLARVGQLP